MAASCYKQLLAGMVDTNTSQISCKLTSFLYGLPHDRRRYFQTGNTPPLPARTYESPADRRRHTKTAGRGEPLPGCFRMRTGSVEPSAGEIDDGTRSSRTRRTLARLLSDLWPFQFRSLSMMIRISDFVVTPSSLMRSATVAVLASSCRIFTTKAKSTISPSRMMASNGIS